MARATNDNGGRGVDDDADSNRLLWTRGVFVFGERTIRNDDDDDDDDDDNDDDGKGGEWWSRRGERER